MLHKNIFLKTGVAVIALVIGLGSCSKTIDLLPSDYIDASKAFRNMEDINMGTIGVYATLGTSDITNNSLVSDEAMLPNENNTGGNVSTYRWQYDGTNGTITAAFAENAIAIDKVNRVLANIDKVTSTAADAPLKDRYRGELLALRAYCHFELIRNFGAKYEAGALATPYVEESDLFIKPTRLKFEEAMAKVKADLATAKGLIPSSFTDRTRINKLAISAIQARVAIYEKNWADAITYSTEAINSLPLATKTQFADVWIDKSDAEVFWKLKRVTGDALLGSFYFNTGGVILYAPSYKLIDAMNTLDTAKDIRYKAYIKYDDTRGTGKHLYRVSKYAGGGTNLADVKLYRTGEMYLIRAEAYAETPGKLAEAAADLNALRAARVNGYVDQSFAGKDALIDAIYLERFKELAFEGHRFFDLRRRNLPIIRTAADAINNLGAVQLQPTEAQYAFPIPDYELKANKNMEQNPKY